MQAIAVSAQLSTAALCLHVGKNLVDGLIDLGDNAILMHAPRFTFAFYYRYWFTGSGRGEARAGEVEIKS